MKSSNVVQSMSNGLELGVGDATTARTYGGHVRCSGECPLSKRTFDLSVAFVLLVLALPTFLLVMLALRCQGGPIFYSHRRIGAGGRSFDCLKFRTMVPNGDEVLAAKLSSDPVAFQEWNAKRKLAVDPRVTKVGRYLRKLSLDELPQLINVLRGDMSLVGPRPIVRDEAERYGADLEYYIAVRPGITGLWQISGRSNTTFDQRVALDRSYVLQWRLRFDIVILLKTIPALLSRDGAY